MNVICAMSECSKAAIAKNLCAGHYRRLKRGRSYEEINTPLAPTRVPGVRTGAWAKVKISPSTSRRLKEIAAREGSSIYLLFGYFLEACSDILTSAPPKQVHELCQILLAPASTRSKGNRGLGAAFKVWLKALDK